MPKYISQYKTPRFLALLKKTSSKTMLEMKLEDWHKIKPKKDDKVFDFDLSLTPIGNKDLLRNVLGCSVEALSNFHYEIKVYRYDPKDTPPINIDTYMAYENYQQYPDFWAHVHSSTSFDENFINHNNDTIGFQMIEIQDDHHPPIEDIPKEIIKNLKNIQKSEKY